MLILSRRTNETIVIGNDITITIIEVRGDQVRIGISAPKDVKVYRKEVFAAMSEANRAAAATIAPLPAIDFLTSATSD